MGLGVTLGYAVPGVESFINYFKSGRRTRPYHRFVLRIFLLAKVRYEEPDKYSAIGALWGFR
jgi:hypothetical protein